MALKPAQNCHCIALHCTALCIFMITIWPRPFQDDGVGPKLQVTKSRLPLFASLSISSIWLGSTFLIYLLHYLWSGQNTFKFPLYLLSKCLIIRKPRYYIVRILDGTVCTGSSYLFGVTTS